MTNPTMFASNIIPSEFHNFYQEVATAWDASTSAYDQWGEDGVPVETGQCAVTALLLQEKFGGTLMRANVNGNSHYWNLIHGETVDFTRGQFTLPLTVTEEAERDRSYVLSFPITVTRYELLKSRLGMQ